MPSRSPLVVIATFDSVAEAAVVQALLEAHGIGVSPDDTAPVGLVWPIAHLLGKVPLRVAEAEAGAALALVQAYQRGDLAVTDDGDDSRSPEG